MALFTGKSPEPLYRIMQSRQSYNIISKPSRIMGEQPNIDLTSRRKRLYGKVDSDGDPIMLLPGLLERQFTNSDVSAVGFIADACNEFMAEYNGKILDNPGFTIPNLGALSVVKQQVRFDDISLQKRKIVANFFVSYYSKIYGKKISNFEEFVKVFMRWADESATNEPVTNSSIMLSHSVPHAVTGLVVEFGDYDENDDNLRASIVSHENFSIYSNMAAKYGFYITRNSPWRLIANIESSTMQQYIDNYVVESYSSIDDFFDDFYIKAHKLDLRDTRTLLVATYNSFVHFNPVIKDEYVCNDGSIRITNRRREKVELDELDRIYEPYWWLSRVYDLRCFESGMKKKTQTEKNNIYERIKKKFETNGTQEALDFINEAIKNKY